MENNPASDKDAPDSVIDALGSLLKSQAPGGNISNEAMAQLLINNMTALVKQGKLSHQQILQVYATLGLL